MYKDILEKPKVHFVTEPQLDFFSYTKENDLENSFAIASKNKKIQFESIGKNTLLGNGNCVDYLKFIKSSTIDLILTDPPYNLGNFMRKRNTNLVKIERYCFMNHKIKLVLEFLVIHPSALCSVT